MLKNTLVKNEYFWKVLKLIESATEDYIEIEPLLESLRLTEEKLMELVSFLNLFEYDIKVEKKLNGNRLLKLPNPRPSFNLNLNFSQWLGIQTNLFRISKVFKDAPVTLYNNLHEKVIELQEKHPQYNYFEVIEREREKQRIFFKICNQKKTILEKVENSVTNKLCLTIDLKEDKAIDIFIHQVVFLDGGLSIVAEDTSEKCLIYFNLNNIENIKLSYKERYKPTYTPYEISDFINSVRSVIGAEDRLVLKIKDQEKVSLSPPYQFLGNPFITSNMNGDIIWAATVERSTELYRWLDDIFEYVEILDPQNLMEDYQRYRSINSSYKKAG